MGEETTTTDVLGTFRREAGMKSWTPTQVLAETLLVRALCGDRWESHYRSVYARTNRVVMEKLREFRFSFTTVTPADWQRLLDMVVVVPDKAEMPEQVQAFYAAMMKVVPARLGQWTAQERAHRFLTMYAGEHGLWQPYWKQLWSYLKPDTVRAIEQFRAAHPTIDEETLRFMFARKKSD